MPTSTKVKNLNINELTEAQYDAAVQGGVIGANELSVLTDVSYVEPSDLATVATTGDYSDLINRPTNLVSTNTAQTISGLKTFSGDITLSGTTSIKNNTGGTNYTMLYRDASTIHVGGSTSALKLEGSGTRPAYNNDSLALLSDVTGGLPSQTGNAGKFLTTDGTDASWSDTPIINGTNNTGNLIFWRGAYGSNIAVLKLGAGPSLLNSKGGTLNGGTQNTIEIGGWADSNLGNLKANNILAKGTTPCLGESATHWNTLYVDKINNGADITVPAVAGEMAVIQVNTAITLTAAGWSSNTQTVSVTGMTATGVVMVSPNPTDQSAYTSAGIICSAQAAGTLTFTCSTTPSADLSVNVVML